MEEFMKSQVKFNNKLLKVIDRIYTKIRDPYKPLECTDELKEIVKIQGEMIKCLSQ